MYYNSTMGLLIVKIGGYHKMKRYISTALISIMILSAFAFTACGGGGGGSDADLSDSKYVGTWKAQSINVGDDSGEIEDRYLLIINADGTGTMTGDDGLNEFTWTPIDGGFKTKGDMKMTFKDDGDNIKTSILIAELIFVKQ